MKCVILYEVIFAFLLLGLIAAIALSESMEWLGPSREAVLCGLIGGVGGATYCLRGVYLSASVRGDWSDRWLPWYFIRPIVSVICGVASWVFLKAGLLVLESQQNPDSGHFAYYALAFIAGLNVDKFICKLEDVALTVWGIEKSRSATQNEIQKKGD
jgi:hypothetical protein